jgi:hypothetical protein
MDDWCVLNMEARDRDDKIVEREMRKFFMTAVTVQLPPPPDL